MRRDLVEATVVQALGTVAGGLILAALAAIAGILQVSGWSRVCLIAGFVLPMGSILFHITRIERHRDPALPPWTWQTVDTVEVVVESIGMALLVVGGLLALAS